MADRLKPRSGAVPGPADERGTRFDGLYNRPGFLIRRANQIAVWLFLEEAAPRPMTTTQYGALVILRAHPDIDQIGLAKLLRIDRSTTALVIGKLEAAGHVRRQVDPRDKRRYILRMTEAGGQALSDMAEPAERARRRLLDVFTRQQAQTFLGLLERYVGEHDDPLPPPKHLHAR